MISCYLLSAVCRECRWGRRLSSRRHGLPLGHPVDTARLLQVVYLWRKQFHRWKGVRTYLQIELLCILTLYSNSWIEFLFTIKDLGERLLVPHLSRLPILLQPKLDGIQKYFCCQISTYFHSVLNEQSQNSNRSSTMIEVWRGNKTRKSYGKCPDLPIKTPTFHIRFWLASGWRRLQPGGRDLVAVQKTTTGAQGSRFLPFFPNSDSWDCIISPRCIRWLLGYPKSNIGERFHCSVNYYQFDCEE